MEHMLWAVGAVGCVDSLCVDFSLDIRDLGVSLVKSCNDNDQSALEFSLQLYRIMTNSLEAMSIEPKHTSRASMFSLPPSLLRGNFQMFIIKLCIFLKELPFSLTQSVAGNKINLC